MKLNVGDYVRTLDGKIFKIKEIKDIDVYYSCNPLELKWQKQTFCILEDKNEAQPISQVKKSSSNIMDLIEVEDYVNGERVIYKQYKEYPNPLLDHYVVDTIRCSYRENEIKSIVTKEQFESMQYKVGE